MDAVSIYTLLGEAKIKELTHLFYLEIANTELLRNMYPKDLAPAEERLFLFLQQVLGGPATYSEQRGHPRLRMRHFAFPIDQSARNQWLACMEKAMAESRIAEPALGHLRTYFYNAANHMVNKENAG